jgi:hypothetical protein
MSFTVIIPARLASTRLPNKPLADLGGKPMVVRVAERARVGRRAHHRRHRPCRHRGRLRRARHRSLHDARRPPVRHRPHRRSGAHPRPGAGRRGGQPAGRRAADRPGPAGRLRRAASAGRADGHLRPSAARRRGRLQPERGQGGAGQGGRALYFSRATIPWHRDAFAQTREQRCRPATCRCAISACMPTATLSCSSIRSWSRRRWKRSKRWNSCACCGMASDRRARDRQAPHAGVDTPEDLARVRFTSRLDPVETAARVCAGQAAPAIRPP